MTSNSHDLKHLQTVRGQLQEQQACLQNQRSALNAQTNLVNAQLQDVERKISAIQSQGKPVVSEHALLRYLERALHLNLDDIRAEILHGRIEQIRQLKTCKIKTGTGLTLVVKNQVVVTVMD